MKKILATTLMAGSLIIGLSPMANAAGWEPNSEETAQKIAILENNVALPESMEGYNRELFPHWRAPSTSPGWEWFTTTGCTVRHAALVRDGEDVTYGNQCSDIKGSWLDTYGIPNADGSVTHNIETNSSNMDADHVIALAEAWRTGAKEWDRDKRIAFANDEKNIMISSASANRSKGDQNAVTYLPPKSDHPESARCEYVDRYITVKADYGLTVSPNELDILKQAVSECGTNDSPDEPTTPEEPIIDPEEDESTDPDTEKTEEDNPSNPEEPGADEIIEDETPSTPENPDTPVDNNDNDIISETPESDEPENNNGTKEVDTESTDSNTVNEENKVEESNGNDYNEESSLDNNKPLAFFPDNNNPTNNFSNNNTTEDSQQKETIKLANTGSDTANLSIIALTLATISGALGWMRIRK